MDALDRAQEADSKFRNQALAAHSERNRQGATSLANCIDCGCVIPDARRKAYQGCERCIKCEEEFETFARR